MASVESSATHGKPSAICGEQAGILQSGAVVGDLHRVVLPVGLGVVPEKVQKQTFAVKWSLPVFCEQTEDVDSHRVTESCV